MESNSAATFQTSTTSNVKDQSFRQRFSDFSPGFNAAKPHTSRSFLPNPQSNEQFQEVVRAGIPVSTLETKYQRLFGFPFFNSIQSQAFSNALGSYKSMVISSPTGSGKTAVFELTIIKLLQDLDFKKVLNPKIIYMAPVKALCSERFADWSFKFGPLGVKCVELTGDTDVHPSEFMVYMNQCRAVLMLTTPEKWDSLTRKWRDYGTLITSINLFLIDEVHLLNENHRGPTLEAVVSRMRTVRLFTQQTQPIRFVACSATIPNASDLAQWLGSGEQPALLFQTSEDQRPVRLERIILGFFFSSGSSLFKFDLSLNYKIPDLISKYSNGKPTLIFCSTRKGAQQTAVYLAKMLFTQIVRPEVENQLRLAVDTLQDTKIREILIRGVGFHHAGLSMNDRRIIEQLFLTGTLPVLVSTSTLALGVNLPAHLVIVKSTTQMVAGSDGQEYSIAQLLQMIGRAGRPQFDKTATAVIMTKQHLKDHYETALAGGQTIESCLHLCLKEHLNAEVTLGTITDVSMAVAWLRTTFLFVRALKEPAKYGIRLPLQKNDDDINQRRSRVEQYLFDLCLRELNALNELGLTVMQDMDVHPTSTGKLMARFYIAFETMALFSKVTGEQSLASLLETISCSSEFSDIQLRVNERKVLNQLNRDKAKVTIRFPLTGRITTRQAKVNCLIQATLGCLPIVDPTLAQETPKVLRLAHRLAKCLVEYLWCRNDRGYDRVNKNKFASSLINAIVLTKCLKCHLWEDSPYVSKQIERIGLVLSRNLVEAGYSTFQSLKEAHPRDLEKVLNRAAPFGSRLVSLFQHLPQYSIIIQQSPNLQRSKADLDIQIKLDNHELLRREGVTTGDNHTVAFVVSDAVNNILIKNRIKDSELLSTADGIQLKLTVNRIEEGDDLQFNLISESWIGLDASSSLTPFYSGSVRKIVKGSNSKPVLSVQKKQFIPIARPVSKSKGSPDLDADFDYELLDFDEEFDSWVPNNLKPSSNAAGVGVRNAVQSQAIETQKLINEAASEKITSDKPNRSQTDWKLNEDDWGEFDLSWSLPDNAIEKVATKSTDCSVDPPIRRSVMEKVTKPSSSDLISSTEMLEKPGNTSLNRIKEITSSKKRPASEAFVDPLPDSPTDLQQTQESKSKNFAFDFEF